MGARLLRSDTRCRAGGFLGGYFASAFSIFMMQTNYWRHIAPAFPNSTLGQIYKHNEHGWISYFDAFQATSSYLMFWTNSFAVVFAMALMPKRNTSVTRWGRFPVGVGWRTDDEKGIAKSSAVVGAVAAPIVRLALTGKVAYRSGSPAVEAGGIWHDGCSTSSHNDCMRARATAE